MIVCISLIIFATEEDEFLKNCKYGTPFILSEPVLSIDNGRLVHVLWGDDMLAARYVSC